MSPYVNTAPLIRQILMKCGNVKIESYLYAKSCWILVLRFFMNFLARKSVHPLIPFVPRTSLRLVRSSDRCQLNIILRESWQDLHNTERKRGGTFPTYIFRTGTTGSLAPKVVILKLFIKNFVNSPLTIIRILEL